MRMEVGRGFPINRLPVTLVTSGEINVLDIVLAVLLKKGLQCDISKNSFSIRIVFKIVETQRIVEYIF